MVCLTSFLRPLYRGSARLQKQLPQWTPKCRGYLTSAISGGQWTQGMKAKLPSFNGTSKCQLCHAAEGTLEHRHCCPVTTPASGWTSLGETANSFISTLSEPRARSLRTRGILTVEIPIAAPQIPTRGWRWLTTPPDSSRQDLTWVIDGSRKYASHWTLSTTGCGVAVLDAEGALIAFATATPPPGVRTAGAAEAWALLLTLRYCVGVPHILTDCMALLHAARAGPIRAGATRNTDARIWKQVVDVTGGDLKSLSGKLTWMPSHTSATGTATRVKSNGACLTTSEWRANQLADALAKRGAGTSSLRKAASDLIKNAGSTLVRSAARRGAVTVAANSHTLEVVREDGKTVRVVKRDSTSLTATQSHARTLEAERKSMRSESKQDAAAPTPVLASPITPPTLLQARDKKRKAAATDYRKAEDERNLAALNAAVAGAAASSRPQATSATERLAALRRRRGLVPTEAAANCPQPLPPLPPATAPASDLPSAAPTSEPAEGTTWTFFGVDSL